VSAVLLTNFFLEHDSLAIQEDEMKVKESVYSSAEVLRVPERGRLPDFQAVGT
jgi:hypothetical protein